MAEQILPNYAGDALAAFYNGQQRGKTNKLAQLLGTAINDPAQRQSALGQAAMIDPQTAMQTRKTLDDQSLSELTRDASMFVALPDDQKAALYPQLAQKAAQVMGHPLPTTYDPKFLPMIQQLASRAGGSATGVQSTYLDDKGQRVAVMRDGSIQVLGANAPNNQIIDTGNGFYGVNKGNLQAAPVVVGGQPQQAPGEVPFSIDPSLPPEVQASIRANPAAYGSAPDGAQVNIPQQLRSVPKPPAPPTQLQLNADARDQARLRLSEEANARAAALAAAKPAPGSVDSAKAEKIKAARADALDSVTQAISGIDTLMQNDGFDNLGTFKGDVLGMIPHTATKDAGNALETVKNQVLLTTLGKLKALSANGASGFGALSNQEGKILQNSIANLETAQSHAAIVHNLKVIRGTLQKAAGLIGGATAQAPQAKYRVGQIVVHGNKKYRVTGGDLNDPDVEEVP